MINRTPLISRHLEGEGLESRPMESISRLYWTTLGLVFISGSLR